MCRLRLDASCSTGPIDTYDWIFDAGGALNGPATAMGQVVTHTYGLFPFCLSRQVTNVLTVAGPGGTDVISQTYRFTLQRTDERPLESSVVTLLAAETPAVVGTLTVNGVSRTVTGSVPVAVPFRAVASGNVVEARLDGFVQGIGAWAFDFETTAHFVRGSLAVEQGELIARTPTRIVFRVDGARAALIRFRFELEPEER